MGTPRSLVLMHLEFPVPNARIDAGGDDALDFWCVCARGVLVAVAIAGCDAAGVPQGGCGQERTLHHKSSRSAKASSS